MSDAPVPQWLGDWAKQPLDPSVYNLKDDEKAFFRAQTGITSDEQLRQHILKVQEDAYKARSYISPAA